MQDEVNEKTVSLCIRGGKITAQLLKAAMRKALAQMEQEKAKQKQQSKVQKGLRILRKGDLIKGYRKRL